MMYKVGTKLLIISGGNGALGCNGKIGIVMPSKHPCGNGLLHEDAGIVLKLESGSIWKVNTPENGGKYERMSNNYNVDLI